MFADKPRLPILISFTVFVVLFAIQATAGNPRFLYLYPVNAATRKPTPSLDTRILQWMILIGVFFFFWGATNRLLGAALVFLVVWGFQVLWENRLSETNERRINKLSTGVDLPRKQPSAGIDPREPTIQTPAHVDHEYDLVDSSAAISSMPVIPKDGAGRSWDDGEDHD
jgi:hypothetical protein